MMQHHATPTAGKHKTLAAAKRTGRAADAGSFLRINDVIATTGVSRATIYRLLAAGDFPAKVMITKGCVGWWEADVTEWLAARLGRPINGGTA